MTKRRQMVGRHSYELKSGDELCRTCPLPDCYETSPDCPRSRYRKARALRLELLSSLGNGGGNRLTDKIDWDAKICEVRGWTSLRQAVESIVRSGEQIIIAVVKELLSSVTLDAQAEIKEWIEK